MADTTRKTPVAANLLRSTDDERAERKKTPETPQGDRAHDPRLRAARTDPQAGELPAGPENAGLQGHPEESAGNPRNEWTTNSIGIGLAIAALLVIIVVMMVF